MTELEKRIGYEFSDLGLLETALTHTSFSNESKQRVQHNERLEFLGDSVLSVVTADYLYHEWKDRPEGELTRARAALVCEDALFKFSEQIELGKFLKLGHGEEMGGGRNRPSVVSDAFEAVIAAIYLDGGMAPAREFVLRFISEGQTADKDYKTELQEKVQQNADAVLQYEIISEKGPDHLKEFEAVVKLNGTVIGTGSGRSKKAAEQSAAKQALMTE